MRENLLNFLVDLFKKIEKTPRPSMVLNNTIIMFYGAAIGISCAAYVLWINDLLSSPWSYLCAITIPLIAKMVLSWIGTLVVAPSIRAITRKFVIDRTGIEIPEHISIDVNAKGSIPTFAVAVSIALTVYLSGLKPDGATTLSDGMIYYVVTMAGAVAALTENLSSPIVISALWHNEVEYQRSPLYQQSDKQSPNISESESQQQPTRSQRRRATRNKPKGKR